MKYFFDVYYNNAGANRRPVTNRDLKKDLRVEEEDLKDDKSALLYALEAKEGFGGRYSSIEKKLKTFEEEYFGEEVDEDEIIDCLEDQDDGDGSIIICRITREDNKVIFQYAYNLEDYANLYTGGTFDRSTNTYISA